MLLMLISSSANAQSDCEPCQTYVGGPYGWVLPSGYNDADGKHHPCAHYTEKTCVKCGFQWWQKKAEPILSDLCYKCRDEQLEQMNEGKL